MADRMLDAETDLGMTKRAREIARRTAARASELSASRLEWLFLRFFAMGRLAASFDFAAKMHNAALREVETERANDREAERLAGVDHFGNDLKG